MERRAKFVQGVAIALVASCAGAVAALAQPRTPAPCTEDAMIVFDASGSMAGIMAEGVGVHTRRIDQVRKALAKALPRVTRFRRIGLITYGPGPYQQCNVALNLLPTSNAGPLILDKIRALKPSGKTPLTEAVQQAAEVLNYRSKPGVIVLLTDGEETCGGAPCTLGKTLATMGENLTVHVIGMTTFWTGVPSALGIKCLTDETGGVYITAEDQEELVNAFRTTLGCPLLSSLDGIGGDKTGSVGQSALQYKR